MTLEHSIPRDIHHVWWNWRADGAMDDANPFVPHLEVVQRWQGLHPNYAMHLWRRPASYAFVQQHFPADVALFNAYPRHIQRCDVFRCMLLAQQGGVYADMDLHPRRPVEELRARYPKARVIVATEDLMPWRHCLATSLLPIRNGVPEDPLRLANYWIAAAPGHPIFLNILQEMRRRAALPVRSDYDVLYTTGPDVLTTVINRDLEQFDDVVIIPRQEADMFFVHANDGRWRQEAAPGPTSR